MAKPIIFEGKTYTFPDDATDAEIAEALDELTRAEAPAPFETSLRPQKAPFPTFQPTSVIEERVMEASRKAGEEAGATALAAQYDDFLTQEARARLTAEENARKARERMVQPGVSRPVEPGTTLPFTRPTRIQEVPTVVLPEAEVAPAPLLEAGQRIVTPGQLPAPLSQEGIVETYGAPEPRRMYLDPDTGKYRVPSVGEEFGEAFQLQTEVSEKRLRDEARERTARELEIKRAIDKGEVPPIYSAFIEPVISGVLTQEREGAGIVETGLAAGLRAGLGAISAAAAEGYFRGLGYEVDERGIPKDPDDYAIAIQNFRRSLGVPDVIQPTEVLVPPVRKAAELVGPEAGQAAENFVRALGLTAFPTPGFETQRQVRKTTTFDPEGRKRVTDVEAPDPVEDFTGFVEFEKRRIAENLAKGRSWGDEFLDTPVMADFATKLYGDPDAAFYMGLVPEIAIPAGPELLGGPIGYGVGLAADVARLGSKAKAIANTKKAAVALDAARAAERTATRTLEALEAPNAPAAFKAAAPRQELRVARLAEQRRVAELRAQEALSLQATNTDPRVVRAVAKAAVQRGFPVPEGNAAAAAKRDELLRLIDRKVEVPSDVQRVVREMNLADWFYDPQGGRSLLGVTEAQAKASAKAALEADFQPPFVPNPLPYGPSPTDAYLGTMIDKAADDLLRGAAENTAARFARETVRNTPGDFVSISDNIAVPRFMQKVAKAELANHRKALFLKTSDEVASSLLEEARAVQATSPKTAAKLRELQQRVTAEASARTQAAIKAARKDQIDAMRMRGGTRVEVKGDKLIFRDEPRQSVTTYGLNDLSSGLRKEIQATLRASASVRGVKGNEAADFVRNFDQARPGQRFGMLNAQGSLMRNQLAQYPSWEQVPASLRREALALYDSIFYTQLGPMARKAADTTRAQVFFKAAEDAFSSLGRLSDPQKFPVLGPMLRNFIAKSAQGRTTLAAARAAQEISLKGKTAFRTLRQRFDEAVAQTKSVDDALDLLMRQELDLTPPEGAWDAVFETVYGPKARAAKERAVAQDPTIFNDYPTIQRVRDLDRALVTQGIVTGRSRIGEKLFGPDFRAVMLKVILEQGLKKSLSAEAQQVYAAGAVGEMFPLRGIFREAKDLDDSIKQATAMTPQPGEAKVLVTPEYFNTPHGFRIATVDSTAGEAERVLTEGIADGLFAVSETVPVKAREAVASYGNAFLDAVDAVGTFNRNLQTRLKYGYILPNVPAMAGRLTSQALIPLATIGAVDTLRAYGRLSGKALDYAKEMVLRRRYIGTGITDTNGVYYSPKVLEELGESYNLGLTQAETERIGALSRDLLRAADAQASKVPGRPALSMLNPLDRGFFLRMAEALELNFRKSVFEVGIASGLPPVEAAQLARRSMFDYNDAPEAIQNLASRLMAESGFLYQVTVQGLSALAENPENAVRILKGMRAKAEAQDPYNVHGDKAIKSLGIVEVGDEQYYLPELPIYFPIEATLAAARRADVIVSDLADAYGRNQQVVDAGIVALEQGVANGLEVAAAVINPEALEAYNRFNEGEEYITTGVPTAEPISDEKTFYALMLKAHASDPERLPDGEWRTFKSTYPYKVVMPPAGFADKKDSRFWTKLPPDGLPHLLMGQRNGVDLYMAVEPTNDALTRIKFMRSLTPDTIEQLRVVYAAYLNENFNSAAVKADAPPLAIFPEPAMGAEPSAAALELLLPPVSMTPEEARRRQTEAVRAVREQVKVD